MGILEKDINLTKLHLLSFPLAAQGREKNSPWTFHQSIHLQMATEEQMYNMVTCLRFKRFIFKKILQCPPHIINKNVYR